MPTPWKMVEKTGSEHAHQTALFCWCAMAENFGFDAANDERSYSEPGHAKTTYGTDNAVPELHWFHAIANGGSRGDNGKSRAIRGGQLKAEGVRAGVSDTFLPVKRGCWSGLYIEMKKPGGRVSEVQREFGAFVRSQGFGFVVCDHWEKARDVLMNYLNQ